MKLVPYLAATAGVALVVVLFARQDIRSIVDLIFAAGPALAAAAIFHIVPMIANACAWKQLLPETDRPDLPVLTRATWVRESVNGLLPVARVGGELVAYRIVSGHLKRGTAVGASLVADVTLSVLSQACFALLGLVLLRSTSATGTLLAFSIVGAIAFASAFVVVQRTGALTALTDMLGRLLAGRFATLRNRALAFDDALRAIYERRRDVVRCLAWQLAGWILGSGEIWLVLRALAPGHTIVDAVIIEALIQAVGSAAFFVPAALGVQEGAFVVIGAALGLDAPTALALATARRFRDVVVFVPGLVYWQWTEMLAVRSVDAPSWQARASVARRTVPLDGLAQERRQQEKHAHERAPER